MTSDATAVPVGPTTSSLLRIPADEAQARLWQAHWSAYVKAADDVDAVPVRLVAGVDVAYGGGGGRHGERLVAAVVVLDASTLEPVDSAVIDDVARFPYVPGLFSFRELPPVVRAIESLAVKPDLIVCDGQGLAHPRRFGLACHLGMALDMPTLGCAKSRLHGDAAEPAIERGAREWLRDGAETIGAVLRTQRGVRPVYVSVGHRMSLETACDWVLRLTPAYRLPETTRAANTLVNVTLRSMPAGP